MCSGALYASGPHTWLHIRDTWGDVKTPTAGPHPQRFCLSTCDKAWASVFFQNSQVAIMCFRCLHFVFFLVAVFGISKETTEIRLFSSCQTLISLLTESTSGNVIHLSIWSHNQNFWLGHRVSWGQALHNSGGALHSSLCQWGPL